MANTFPDFPRQAFPELLVHQPGYRRPGAYVGIYCKVLKGGELKTGEGVVSQRPAAFR